MDQMHTQLYMWPKQATYLRGMADNRTQTFLPGIYQKFAIVSTRSRELGFVSKVLHQNLMRSNQK